ncbi:MAG: F0F1 ATP synthase subunit A [Deltaproteobacteria bacterium]|nr:F0F1 ATP synthase subunit A [Deltaproteobacteria bacterium]
MDHHTTWWSFLPFFGNLRDYLHHVAKPVVGSHDFLVHHVLTTALVVCIIAVMAFMARGHFSDVENAVIPPRKFGVAAFFELLVDALLGLMKNIIGKDHRRYFPLVGGLALYIFCSNLVGLIPGMAPPTDNLNTTAGCGITVFLYYNYQGLRVNGLNHIAHMANPVGTWWGWLMAPLMFPIELIGHLARPMSLSLRLMGNMMGDHQVLFAFAGLVPVLVPLPFYVLGFLVCVIQTAVFCILTCVYIGTSVAEAHHDEDHAHGAPAHAH